MARRSFLLPSPLLLSRPFLFSIRSQRPSHTPIISLVLRQEESKGSTRTPTAIWLSPCLVPPFTSCPTASLSHLHARPLRPFTSLYSPLSTNHSTSRSLSVSSSSSLSLLDTSVCLFSSARITLLYSFHLHVFPGVQPIVSRLCESCLILASGSHFRERVCLFFFFFLPLPPSFQPSERWTFLTHAIPGHRQRLAQGRQQQSPYHPLLHPARPPPPPFRPPGSRTGNSSQDASSLYLFFLKLCMPLTVLSPL